MKKSKQGKTVKNMPAGTKIVTYVCLAWALIVSLVPLVWLVLSSLKKDPMARPGFQLPDSICIDGYISTFRDLHVLRYFGNSLFVAGVSVLISVVMISMSAYVVARMEFKGKKIAFFSILATIMVPFQAIMLPVYLITLKLHLVDSVNDTMGFIGLVMPFAVSAFGIFLMRQAFMTIPREMEEAAIVDGCNVFQVFWKVLLPMVKPSLAVLAIFTFIGSWGEFLWPSIVLTKEAMYTLPVGVNNLQGMFSSNWRFIAAGSIISTIPIIIFFLAMQKYFISGENDGAIKG